MARSVYYTTKGSLRGRCGHQHHDIDSALQCQRAEEAHCVAKGGHTDRRVFAVRHGAWRELTDEELTARAELHGIQRP